MVFYFEIVLHIQMGELIYDFLTFLSHTSIAPLIQ